MQVPKLPLVSCSRMRVPSALKSHTLMRPSCVTPARYWPSSEIAMAQASAPVRSAVLLLGPLHPAGYQRGVVLTSQFSVCSPMTILARPGLNFTIKSCGDCTGAIPIDRDMMAANGVSTINGLHQRKVSVRGGMYFDGRGTRDRQDLLVGYSQREDIKNVRCKTDISQIMLQGICGPGSPPLSAEPLERYCFD